MVKSNKKKQNRDLQGGSLYFAFILLPLASWVSSANSNFSRGGIYIPNLPRNPFFKPYQPLIGFWGDRPHASMVPSLAV
jgi:hypothetical protein